MASAQLIAQAMPHVLGFAREQTLLLQRALWPFLAAGAEFERRSQPALQSGPPSRAVPLPHLSQWVEAAAADGVNQILSGRASLAAVARTAWAGLPSNGPLPMPTISDIDSALSLRVIDLARDDTDLPRPFVERVGALANAIMASKPLRASLAPNVSSAWQLAEQWALLFERWDWLRLHWMHSGAPTAQEPAALAGLELILGLYEASQESLDLAEWVSARAASCRHISRGRLLVSGHLDFFDWVRCQLAWPGQWEVVQVGKPELIEAQRGWSALWPELTDLSRAEWSPQRAAEGWAPLRSRLATWKSSPSFSRMSTVDWVETDGVESTARCAADQIGQWLSAGHKQIGVVAGDRLAARRLAAVLKSRDIDLDDPSGWALDTTVAFTAIDGLISILLDPNDRKAWMTWIRCPPVSACLSQLGLLAESEWAGFYRSLRSSHSERLYLAKWAPKLHGWFLTQLGGATTTPTNASVERIEALLRALELEEALLNDAAGQRVWAALRGLGASLGGRAVDLRMLRTMLGREMTELRLPIRAPDASVRIIGLIEATHINELDSLIVIGAHEGAFPRLGRNQLLPPGRMEIAEGAPPRRWREAAFLLEFASSLDRGCPTLVIAQSQERGASVLWAAPLARAFALLTGTHAPRFWCDSSSLAGPNATGLVASTPPVARLQSPLTRVRVSQLADALICPFRFYWRVALGLTDLRDLRDEEDALDLGTWVHRMAEQAVASELAAEPNESKFEQAWRQWLGQRLDAWLEAGELSLPMAEQLRAIAPGFAQWLADQAPLDHVNSEMTMRAPLESLGLTLEGRLDWLDRVGQDNGPRLIDFKVSRAKSIQDRVKNEYLGLQLQAYAWMLTQSGRSAKEMGFVSMSWEGSEWLEMQAMPDDWNALLERLAAFQAGDAMPPLAGMAGEKTCEQCAARGICRVRVWGSRA